jgi:deoxyribodipyrimidine photo-lyase
MTTVPEIRIKAENKNSINADGDYVLYWMIACRRVTWNFGLQRAVAWGEELSRPLLILEALRCNYPWASDRFHAFIIQGMADNARRLQGASASYYPYVEPGVDEGKGLLAALGTRACVVVTDHFPAFMIPRMVAAAAKQLPVRLESVDANGLLPLRAAPQVFATAYAFRRYLQKHLLEHLDSQPEADPLAGTRLPTLDRIPTEILNRWPMAGRDLLASPGDTIASIPIDHGVAPSLIAGSTTAAEATWHRFLGRRLNTYGEDRNHPDLDAGSGLSPYLHFGHISAHQVFSELMSDRDWSIARLSPLARGQREGWWGLDGSVEAFLDQLITWRELGFNYCEGRNDHDQYESLPPWALQTLAEHARDRRTYSYSLQQLEAGRSHDLLWNATQTQLLREGRLHNYLRMLWGKKILEWSPSPREALAAMIQLNNKYALDGRDPNSYTGIFWVLGRYDRPWGPERPVFGKVRFMSSANTARKVLVTDYLHRYAGHEN